MQIPRLHFRGIFHCTLRLLGAALFGLTAATSPALAAEPLIDSIIVKLRAPVPPEAASPVAADDVETLSSAMRAPLSLVGHTRDGGYKFELLQPLPLDAARAAVNRVRMLPQVLYASISDNRTQAAADNTSIRDATSPTQSVHRLIVKYRDATTQGLSNRNERLPAFLLDRLSALAGQLVAHERAMSDGAFVVRLFQPLPLDQAKSLARYLELDSSIEYAEADLLKQPLLVPNDPSYASQWHYQSPPGQMGGVNLPPAWDLTTGASGIFIAVIDTGIVTTHPDLAGRFVGGYDFVSNTVIANDGDGRDADASDPGDWVTAAESANPGILQGCGSSNSSFHGTHVAGTIGAATGNAMGVAGINWVSKILPARVLGKCGGFTSDIADAIRWSAGLAVPGVPPNSNPARVLNLSLGGYACDASGQNCVCDTTSQNAINAAVGAGAVVVAAAGNSNANAIQSAPGNCNGVITVGATSWQGQRARYSNYGTLVEISAPGGDDGLYVLSTVNTSLTSPNPANNGYYYKQGTSMATPHVAGIASLMLSRNPSLTPAQVLSKIQTTARPFPTGTIRDCTTALCGAGIINAAAAVLSAAGTTAVPTTTTLVSSGTPAVAGTTVTFTATITGTNPTGNVNFTDGGSSIAGCSAVALSGAGNSKTAGCATSSLAVGTHSIVTNYSGDPANASSSSAPLSQVITAVAGSSNVALASAGAVASASSTYGTGFAVSSVNDNQPTGAPWANNGGWLDGTANAWPDWVQINFTGSKTIDRVVVYSIQDNFNAPQTPTDNMTFTLYGLRDFAVQGWQNGNWVTLASVTGNSLVKRSVSFPATTTDRIRIYITNALYNYSRIAEIEAWGINATGPLPATVGLASSSSPVVAGTPVTFTATVTGTSPTGNVGFTDNGNPVPGCSAVTLAGSGNSRTAACSTSTLTAGTHSIIATYGGDTNNGGASSAPLSQVINPGTGTSTNVALAGAGAVASASSTYGTGFAVSSVNDNQPTGAPWANNGGWLDGTADAWPDWVQINFTGSKTIDRVVVYSIQDNFSAPQTPTDNMTFTLYGLRDFAVQGWQNGNWVTLASVTGNSLVKRSVSFPATTTDRIRIYITNALYNYSRIAEIEAWTATASPSALALQSSASLVQTTGIE